MEGLTSQPMGDGPVMIPPINPQQPVAQAPVQTQPEAPATPAAPAESKEDTVDINFDPFAPEQQSQPKPKRKDDDSPLDPEDRKTIGKEITNQVTDALTPTLTEVESIKADLAVNNFLGVEGNEDFKPYAERIRSVAKNAKAKGLSMDSVVAIALGIKGLMKIGADRYAKAASRAAQSVSGGQTRGYNPAGGDGNVKPATQLTPQEWAKVKAEMGV